MEEHRHENVVHHHEHLHVTHYLRHGSLWEHELARHAGGTAMRCASSSTSRPVRCTRS
jgi:hypothetical protein